MCQDLIEIPPASGIMYPSNSPIGIHRSIGPSVHPSVNPSRSLLTRTDGLLRPGRYGPLVLARSLARWSRNGCITHEEDISKRRTREEPSDGRTRQQQQTTNNISRSESDRTPESSISLTPATEQSSQERPFEAPPRESYTASIAS